MTFNHSLARISLGLAACVALVARAEAQCGVADVHEDNDDCANAVTLTPGTHTGLTCQGPGDPSGDDRDYYRVTVPAGDMLIVDVLHSWSDPEDLDAYLYEATNPNCGDQSSYLVRGYTSTDNEGMAWLNTSGASADYIIEVSAFLFGTVPVICDDYDLVIYVGPDPCVAAVDDSFEQNDSCATAAVLPVGSHSGLFVSAADEDFYRVTVAAGDLLLIDQTYNAGLAELQLDLYDDPSCTNLVDSFGWGGGANQVAAANATGVPKDFFVRVFVVDQTCTIYSLDVTTQADPCQLIADDSFEPNDNCGVFATLAAGTQTGLFVSTADEDYYKINLAAAEQVIIDQTYVSAFVELELTIYDDSGCSTFVDGDGWGGGFNQVIASNTSGAAKDFYLRVNVVDQDCGNYDLTVTLQPDPCQSTPDDSFEPNDDCLSAVSLPAGTTSALFVSEFDEDHYKINVAAGEQVIIDQTYVASLGELEIYLFDDPACTNTVDSSGWNGGSNQVSYGNATGAALDYYVRVSVVDGDCNNYDLNVTLQPDPCLASGLDDSFEDNDFCGSGVALPAGSHTGLFVAGVDEDYYEITVPSGDQVTIDQVYNPSIEVYMELYSDPSCSTWETDAGWNGGFNSLTWANSTGASAIVYLHCGIDTFYADCGNYDLTVTIAPDPCQLPTADDALEDNETCATAYTISSQVYSGLFVSKADNDVYTFQLNDGGTADITILHTAANGDIDFYLYDDTPGLCLDGSSYLTSGQTGDDDEVLFWSNTTGNTMTYFLHIDVWAGSPQDCNNYDLDVSLVGNQIATPTCAGDATFDAGAGTVACPCGNNSAVGAGEGCVNSQGHGATIEATGSNVVANDNAVFHVAQARPNQPSLLVQGAVLTGFPFKDGILCLGNPTERVEVVILDASGAGSTSSSIVTEGAIPGPGVTRYYQFWYRDPAISICGNGSNFSAGLCMNWL